MKSHKDNTNKTKKQFRLQTKLFFIYILFSETIVLSFALFFYQYMANILTANEIETLQNLNSSNIVQVEAMINDLDDVSANINYSNRTIGKQEAAYSVPFTNDSIIDLTELFTTINGTDLKSHQINLYDLEGNVARVGLRTNIIQVNLKSLTWFDEVIALDGLKYISNPYKSDAYLSDGDWYVSLSRTFSSPYGEKIGVIEVIKRCSNVFKSIISYEKKEDNSVASYVFNSEGVLIYPYDIKQIDKAEYSLYYSYIKAANDDHRYLNATSNQQEYIVSEASTYSGWTYLTVQPKSVVLAPVNSLIKWIGIIVGIIFLMAIIISYLLAKNMIKPVKSLKKIIQKQKIDTLGDSIADDFYTSYAELAEVYEDYSKMCGKLESSMHELIESRHQEVEARLRALQSQTNPHFFYNTLSNIIVLSENNQNAEIVQLCRNLTKLMRYITDNYVTKVTIKEELEYVQKYLYCMKVRYQESLKFEYDIDDSLLEIIIPKLVIQPLVENAIKHGTDCLPPWKIQIIGKKTETGWYINAIDSGNGFKPSILRDMKKKIEVFKQTSNIQELKVDGFGLMNIYIRLKYFFKDTMIFDFGNTEDGHGYVTIGQDGKINEDI